MKTQSLGPLLPFCFHVRRVSKLFCIKKAKRYFHSVYFYSCAPFVGRFCALFSTYARHPGGACITSFGLLWGLLCTLGNLTKNVIFGFRCQIRLMRKFSSWKVPKVDFLSANCNSSPKICTPVFLMRSKKSGFVVPVSSL